MRRSATLRVNTLVLAQLFGLDLDGAPEILTLPVIDREGTLRPEDQVEGVVRRAFPDGVHLSWRLLPAP